MENASIKLDNTFAASYVRKASALLHGHLIGLSIPESLKEEYLFVLQEAPRLLDVFIDMTLSRERYLIQGIQLIQLKQAIIQGVWPFESKLKQLPHWTPAIDRALIKEGYDDILKLNFLLPDKLHELLMKVYSKYSNDYSDLLSNDDNNDKSSDKKQANAKNQSKKSKKNKKKQEAK